jgi:hypothetical protein
MIKFLEETTSKKPSEIFTNQDVAWTPFPLAAVLMRVLVARAVGPRCAVRPPEERHAR